MRISRGQLLWAAAGVTTPASGQFVEPASRPHPGTADLGTR